MRFPRPLVLLPLLLPLAAAPRPAGATSETTRFRLYKFQQAIGTERAIAESRPDGSTEIRTTFAFNDRGTTVPLASLLSVDTSGAPLRFQIWGSTSRHSTTDERVTVAGGIAEIEHAGETRREPVPERFFVTGGYAPVSITERLWMYWNSHGRPAELPVLPTGEVLIAARGFDEVTDDTGAKQRLGRFSVGGLAWGRETIWIDGNGRLAAEKAIDAEFDHFEAVRAGYTQALGDFVRIAAADGLAELAELGVAVAAGGAAAGETPGAPTSGAVAWIGATLVDATGAAPVPDSVVVVDGDRIVAAGPRSKVRIPRGARRVDVRGQTILPGLWDMHAHFQQVEWGPVYLAAGVTTVRDCANELDFVRAARDAVASGKGLGPRILLACIVDGQGPRSVGTSQIREVAEIAPLVETFRAAGCAQVKIYSSLPPNLIAPLATAAHAAGMTVTGHIPAGIGAVHAVEAGLNMINHLHFVTRALLPPKYDPDATLPAPVFRRAAGEIDLESPEVHATLDLFARRGVVVDPTIALAELGSATHEELLAVEPGLEKLAPPLRPTFETFGAAPGATAEETAERRRLRDLDLAIVRALHAHGVAIVAGTDQAVPGYSIHREMELYVEAGLSPMEAIRSATAVPAKAMRLDSELGTIAPGMRADLILVDGDPLTDIRNLRRVTTVVTGGRAYATAPLWKLVGFTP